MYHNQIVHRKPCFNLLILHNNLFDNQGSEINKNNIFLRFDILSFIKNFLLTTIYIHIHKYIHTVDCTFSQALDLDVCRY